MKKLIYILMAILLFDTQLSSQWVEQISGNNLTKYNVRFANQNTGWVTGTNSLIMKTTNGGINWIQQTSPVLGRELNGIQMFDANTGYIAGWTNTFLKTTNGGNNWIQLSGPSATNGSINAISFIDVNTGWACGFLGIIWRTTNGGLNFYPQTIPLGGGFHTDIFFYNDSIGWATIVNHILHTTNGGGEFVSVNPISEVIPKEYKLLQNYPNPFNVVTVIDFQIIKKGYTRIEIFNALGQLIETPVEQEMKPGEYQIKWNAGNYPTGTYFYRLSADGYFETKKMILIK